MRIKPTFMRLRGKLAQYGMTEHELAASIGRSYGYVTNCFRGLTTWRLDEMYAILDMFRIPYDRLHEYFPKDGKDAV